MTQIDHGSDIGSPHPTGGVAIYVAAASGASFALLAGTLLVQHGLEQAWPLDWAPALGALLFMVFGIAAVPGFVASSLFAHGVSGLAALPAVLLAASAALTPLASVALLRRTMPFSGSLTDIRLSHLAMLACFAAATGTALEVLPAAMAGLLDEATPIALAASFLAKTAGGFVLIVTGMAATRLRRLRRRTG